MNRFEKQEYITMYEQYRYEHPFVKDVLIIVSGSNKVLLLGCGSGREPTAFCNIVPEVVGIDSSKKMIDIAKVNEPRCKYYVGEAMEVLDNNEDLKGFDYIIGFSNFLGYYDKDQRNKLIQRLEGRLNENGKLIFALKFMGDEKLTRTRTVMSAILAKVFGEKYELGDIYFLEFNRKDLYKHHWFLKSRLEKEFNNNPKIIFNTK